MLVDSGYALCGGIIGILEKDLFPVHQHLSLIRLMYPRDHLDQRGFSRSVFSHERVDLALFQPKLHMVQRHHARKAFCNIF